MDILYIYSYAKLFSEHGSGTEVVTDTEEQDGKEQPGGSATSIALPNQIRKLTEVDSLITAMTNKQMGKGLKNSDYNNMVNGLVKEKEEIATANKSYL